MKCSTTLCVRTDFQSSKKKTLYNFYDDQTHLFFFFALFSALFSAFISAYFNTREVAPLVSSIALAATVGCGYTARLGAMAKAARAHVVARHGPQSSEAACARLMELAR